MCVLSGGPIARVVPVRRTRRGGPRPGPAADAPRPILCAWQRRGCRSSSANKACWRREMSRVALSFLLFGVLLSCTKANPDAPDAAGTGIDADLSGPDANLRARRIARFAPMTWRRFATRRRLRGRRRARLAALTTSAAARWTHRMAWRRTWMTRRMGMMLFLPGRLRLIRVRER